MKFKFITPNHAYYQDELMLRWEVLRKPQGLPPGSEAVPDERECIHLLVMDHSKILGCLLFHPETETSGRLLQMAISEESRGHGFARKLLHALEMELIKRGVLDMYVQAREDLQDFYHSLGFHYTNDEVSQGQMRKTIDAASLKSA